MNCPACDQPYTQSYIGGTLNCRHIVDQYEVFYCADSIGNFIKVFTHKYGMRNRFVFALNEHTVLDTPERIEKLLVLM